MLDALLVVAKWGTALALAVLAIWAWLTVSSKREMNGAITRARHLFAFLEAKGFTRTADHRGDSFDFVWVEYERDAVIARVVREKTYWGLELKRKDRPEVYFDAIEAFPLIGLDEDPCLPYGHRSPEALAASVEPVLDLLVALVDPEGMKRIERLREAAILANRASRQVPEESREKHQGV